MTELLVKSAKILSQRLEPALGLIGDERLQSPDGDMANRQRFSSVHELVPKPGCLAYSISKGGLGNLTRTLALEFAGCGIRVNAVGPGATVTDLNRAWTGDAASAVAPIRPAARAIAAARDLVCIMCFLRAAVL